MLLGEGVYLTSIIKEGGPEGVVLRGRACLELSSSWITSEFKQQRISIGKEATRNSTATVKKII